MDVHRLLLAQALRPQPGTDRIAAVIEKHAKAAGLGDVEAQWLKFSGGNVMNDALLSGNLDFAATGRGRRHRLHNVNHDGFADHGSHNHGHFWHGYERKRDHEEGYVSGGRCGQHGKPHNNGD